jgi:hypothetical protein
VTLSQILRRLDIALFERILGEWVAQFLPAESREPTPVHLDGKTLRGSRPATPELPGVHRIAAFAPQIQGVLAQLRVDAQTNEHQAALELLDILPRRPEGHVITGDAMFCQKDICEKVLERGDDYLFTVKANQPSLVIDIDAV